jgi:hypothetical protein
MMEYKYLQARGALNEAGGDVDTPPDREEDLATRTIPPAVLELIPEALARENVIMPLAFDGETITLASASPENIALADRLRFILAKNVRFVAAPQEVIAQAIDRHYGAAETESVDSMLSEFTDTSLDYDLSTEASSPAGTAGRGIVDLKRDLKGVQNTPVHSLPAWASLAEPSRQPPHLRRQTGLDIRRGIGRSGMFYHVVEEGQRVLMRRPNGTMQVIAGPKRIWRGRNVFQRMDHYVAHPNEFLIVRFRDGRQQHLAGPTEVWFDPREHLEITREDALQLSAKEAVVVYSKSEGSDAIQRRLVYGPALFVPEPGEWLHTFSWHASKGGSRGVQKVPNALVFQKLWLMPDQMYHDVPDVRTADDAVLTIRLMLFFELIDIERMLDSTHDPIGDFVNAATSDVVDFTGPYDFESFKRQTTKLNDLDTYKQLTGRAGQCGYRINKVVFRGYSAADSLQQMHNQAIEARTRLQLDRATEQQAQELENYKLDSQLARSGKRRTEQAKEVEHELELARKRQEAEMRQREAQQAFVRETRRLEAEWQLELRQRQDAEQREHLVALRDLGVDLTAFLTQARADRVIELRGTASPHVHLDRLTDKSNTDGDS